VLPNRVDAKRPSSDINPLVAVLLFLMLCHVALFGATLYFMWHERFALAVVSFSIVAVISALLFLVRPGDVNSNI